MIWVFRCWPVLRERDSSAQSPVGKGQANGTLAQRQRRQFSGLLERQYFAFMMSLPIETRCGLPMPFSLPVN
jgi:hypothetical protein